ncbi:hypothetical protein D5R93_05690 [Actinomyces lilanjuaniae]|uniref:NlpC/P60 domain-containing protein n=1 Tax=Actinomyces lilanjuaniae TaxID=2321394 RepID=A0ABM6Z2X9_9ACTO|nr:hypothetical protein D5R93_05690 [Actinomyces lilanjuaniae]
MAPAFRGIATVVSWAWNNVVRPSLAALRAFITNVVAPVVTWLWNNVVAPAFNGIRTVVSTVVGFLTGTVFPRLRTAVNLVGTVVSWLWNNVVTPAFNGIRTVVSTVVGFLTGTVFPRLRTAVRIVGNAFSTFRTTVQKAFDAVRGAAARPVNFVINTVYRDGVKKMFDTVASKVGLSLRLPSVSPIPGYATGGLWGQTMTPGYTRERMSTTSTPPTGRGHRPVRRGGDHPPRRPARPGRQEVAGRRQLRPWGRPGHRRDTGSRRGQVAFADGGIWGSLKNTVSSAVSWVKDTADAVSDILSDPLGAVTNLVTKPADALLNQLGPDLWAQTVKAVPKKWWSSIRSWFKKGTETSAGGAAGGPATGLVAAARKAIGVPYVWGGSSIPPGLDCSGLVYWAARQLGWGWPRLTAAGYQSGSAPVAWGAKVPGDLLFWGRPAWHVAIYSGGNSMVEEPRAGLSGRETAIWGSPSVGRYGGRKYDAGGVLPPGLTTAVNLTRRPEAVLTGPQWDAVSALAARGVDLAGALDGARVSLVVDDTRGFDSHVEVVAAGVARARQALSGRAR